MSFFLIAGLGLSAVLLLTLWRRHLAWKREAFIRSAEFPRGLFERLQKVHPKLSAKDCQLVGQGLRQFFLAYLKSGKAYVSMPSQVVDDLWHEFILFTKNYEAFCFKAFGGFLHHTPVATLKSSGQSNAGLRRCWWHVCKEENINPVKPTRLPLLFALDAKLSIPGGFVYLADCKSSRSRQGDGGGSGLHCGGDFSDATLDGGLDGLGDAGGDGSGGDSGCGGGGCGGD